MDAADPVYPASSAHVLISAYSTDQIIQDLVPVHKKQSPGIGCSIQCAFRESIRLRFHDSAAGCLVCIVLKAVIE